MIWLLLLFYPSSHVIKQAINVWAQEFFSSPSSHRHFHFFHIKLPLSYFLITWSLEWQRDVAGVARWCGWQHIGAYINLGAFYLFGIPIAMVLGFVYHLGGKGLWIGIVCGSAIQVKLLYDLNKLAATGLFFAPYMFTISLQFLYRIKWIEN